ncbi:MAG: anhydro-N-acetylmuramic acid kinase [Proteobacteria bacterium]|nr:anhydro-N-acetylmuramic acid kinase [Pseudomonadota bacterium]
MYSIGLMSGTSMDGIDAALIETDGTPNLIMELGDHSLSYDPEFKTLLKAAEYAVRKSHGDMDKAASYYKDAIQDYLINELKISADKISSELEKLLSYAKAHSIESLTLQAVIQLSTKFHILAVQALLEKTGYKAQQIDLIGYHGQTLFHKPSDKISIIVGDGQTMANELGVTVINDFRSRDVEAGGQGAPFAPLYHQALAVRDKKIPLAVVNCGGISNITLIRNANESDLIGFDTGPGNALLDRLMRQRTHGKEHMDTDGRYGKHGRVNEVVLKALYEKSIIQNGKNYFSVEPPKSLDYGDMELISELDALSLEDACRTLEAFTADSIVKSLELLDTEIPQHWVLAGGGWKNPVIREEFESRLRKKSNTEIHVLTADEAGWNSQAMEAQIFAYLAVLSFQNKPLSFPGTTRVPKPLSGGCMHKPTALVNRI